MPDLPNSTDVRMMAYRRLMPLALIAFLGSWAAHALIGGGLEIDAWLLLATPAVWVFAWWLTTRSVVSVPALESIILTTMAAFFLVKMTFVAWIVPDAAWYDALEFSLYLPGFFAMAYWSSPRRRAWIVSWVFLTVFLLVASPFLVGSFLAGEPAGVGFALVFVHLVLMSALMIEFLRAYGDTVFSQRLEVHQAERLASVDELTKVENRRGLERRLRSEAERMLRTGVPYSVVVVDLDHFKHVNDTFGHVAGDDVLRDVGRVLREGVRDGDHVGRWGGEEFAVVCPAASTDAASSLAERLRHAIRSTSFTDGIELTASFGVAEARPEESIEEVVERADAALYTAKREGRDRVRVAPRDEARRELAFA